MSAVTVDQVLDALAEGLMVDRAQFSPETTAEEIAAWDSVGVVEIVFILQREFGVNVTPKEAHRLVSVQEILAVLRKAGKMA